MSGKKAEAEESPEGERERSQEDLEWVTTFEDLMEVVGTNGRWNLAIFFLCASGSFVCPMYMMSYQFLGATPDHWCHVAPLAEANWTQTQILSLAIPYRNTTGKHDGCRMYDYNYTAAVEIGYEASVDNVSAIADGSDIIKCSSRDFNHTQYQSTIVTEWDLVCDRRYIYSTTQAVVMGGSPLSSIFFGYLTDRWGRRPVALLSSVSYIIVSFLTAVSSNVNLYILFKVIISFAGNGLYISLFVHVIETCATKYRAAVGTLFAMPWALGYMLVPGIAYLVRSWKWLQIAYSVTGMFTIIYFWWLPESPRWLISQHRYQDALKVITSAAKMNRRAMPPDHIVLAVLEKIGNQEAPKLSNSANKMQMSFKSSIYSTLKNSFILCSVPQFRVKFLIIAFCWISVCISYYGIALYATNLSADPYLYVFLGGLLEIPAYILLWPAIIFVGRKKSLFILFCVCGISIILTMMLQLFYPVETESVVVFLAQFSKMAVTAAYDLIWIYAAELFPTKYRSLAIGGASSCGILGSTCSPYINDILGHHIAWAPTALFGLMSLLAAALTLSLPETRHCNMPELENFDKNNEGVTKSTTDN